MENVEIELVYENDNLRCKKCSFFPNITIFNSSNRVKVFTECENKHIDISLLDEYIKNNSNSNNNINKCAKCKNDKNIKICQFCYNHLCEECNEKHLTLEHIINNKIMEKIYDNNYIDNLDKKYEEIKDKIKKSITYIKDIIEYYKQLENNFKKFILDNINEILLIKLLVKNYMNNNNEEKLIKNAEFLLVFNELEFKKENLNDFLSNNKNYILNVDRYKEKKEGKGEMEYYNGKYEGEFKDGNREGFGIYKYDIYIKMGIYLTVNIKKVKKREKDYIYTIIMM